MKGLKHDNFSVRITKEEKDYIKEICKKYNINQSDLFRVELFDNKEVRKRINTRINREAITSINKAGNLLNQIAYKLNKGEVKVIANKGVKILDNRFKAVESLLNSALQEIKGGGKNDN